MDQKVTARPSSAFLTVDLDKQGRQAGFLMIPHSPHEDAWGATRIPIGVIANGRGPTVIIEGGNHGDEYEGPIVISELIRDLDPSSVQGRLILMPAVNIHAVLAARRVSPVDGLNLNRSFPGDPRGSITQQIAAYVTDHIIPHGDVFLDLHSGGSSLDILPSAIIEPSDDPGLNARNAAAARAFCAPLTVVIDNMGESRTATATAIRAGLITVGTEMAGAGRVSLEALALCRRGIRGVLAHLGLLEPALAGPATAASAYDPGPLLSLDGPNAHVFAPVEGVFEPFHPLGATVSAGDTAGAVHFPWDPVRPPERLAYGTSGILYARRQQGHVRPGNCCLVVASTYHGNMA
jgi:N2-acetyl-L-2,4-diaminobutanoate deacetylase